MCSRWIRNNSFCIMHFSCPCMTLLCPCAAALMEQLRSEALLETRCTGNGQLCMNTHYPWNQPPTSLAKTDACTCTFCVVHVPDECRVISLLCRGFGMLYEKALIGTRCRFLVGTEPGNVLLCNRKAKTPADRVGASYSGASSLIALPSRPQLFALRASSYICRSVQLVPRIATCRFFPRKN